MPHFPRIRGELLLLGVFTFALALFLMASQPGLITQNAQVHVAIAQLYAAGHFGLSGLGVLPNSEFARAFVDQHALYHLALVPLLALAPGHLALSALSALGLALLALSLSRLLPARMAALPAALLFCGFPTFDRLFWQRPIPFVLTAIFCALAESMRERPRALAAFAVGLLGFAISFESLLALPVLLAAALLSPPRPGRWRALAGWGAGTIVSLALHPHPWARLRLLGSAGWGHFRYAPVAEWKPNELFMPYLAALGLTLLLLGRGSRWQKAPRPIWAAFAGFGLLALRADRFAPGAVLLGVVTVAWLAETVTFSRRKQAAFLAAMACAIGYGAYRHYSRLFFSDGRTAGDPNGAYEFLSAHGHEREGILLQNWTDWSGLFALDPHTKAEPGFSVSLYHAPRFGRAYFRWYTNPSPARLHLLLRKFASPKPRFVLVRRYLAGRFFLLPDIYPLAYLDKQYALFDLNADPAPAPRVPPPLDAESLQRVWALARGADGEWRWPADLLCLDFLPGGERACWRNERGRAELFEGEIAPAQALRIHWLRAAPGSPLPSAALRSGARGVRALYFPSASRVLLGEDLLFRLDGTYQDLPWPEAQVFDESSYYSPGKGVSYPTAMGMLLAQKVTTPALREASALATSFLVSQVHADGSLLFRRSLQSESDDADSDTPSTVLRKLHAVYALCLAGPEHADVCRRALAKTRADRAKRARFALGELALYGLALAAADPGAEPELAGIERDILARFQRGRFLVDRKANEVFSPGEAALFLSQRESEPARRALREMLPYYTGLYQRRSQSIFMVRWFAEALVHEYDRTGDPRARAFLDKILDRVEKSLAREGWMANCPVVAAIVPMGGKPYPHHIAGIWLEGLAQKSRRNPQLTARLRAVSTRLADCALRQQIRAWNIDLVKRREGSLGTWRFGLNLQSSRLDVQSHMQLGIRRAAALLR